MLHYLRFLCFFFPFCSLAQGYENTMVFGYSGGSQSPTEDKFGLNLLTFSDGNLEIADNQTGEAFFNDTDAAISDTNGNLLFYFNGLTVYNKTHQIMDNGENLNPYNATGYDLPQGAIIIPASKAGSYFLFYEEEGYVQPPEWGPEVTGLYYALIDMNQNNGQGKVTVRKMPLIIDTLEYGRLDVVRHANGRDWWLGVWESHSNRAYRVLIDKTGVHVLDIQTVGIPRKEGIGQAYFSPDGTKYVVFSAIVYAGEYHYLDIYDFDRCTGMYSNHEHFHIPINTFGGGGIISPDSHWLYVSFSDYLYQYDLTASPVEPTAQLIATYVPFNDPFPTRFSCGFLAPDNKIYFTTTSGSRSLHVIHEPDQPGTACNFEQNGIRLICINNSSIPTFANYRLGPIDGSACDTLDIDNDPVSWWRYTQDTLNPNHITFHDLSYQEPTTWSWDFGDGNTSTVRHPEYTYALPGVYEVCLTVSNINGSDTHCKTIYGVTAAENPEVQRQITVAPNPFRNYLGVSLGVPLQRPVFRMYGLAGRAVREEYIGLGINEVRADDLLPGMYFWQVVSGGRVVKTGKCVKVLE